MKRVFTLFLIVFLSLSLFASFSYVEDRAGLLLENENEELETLLKRVSEESQMVVAVLTDTTTNEKGEEVYSDDYYDEVIDEDDGVLLFINMNDRIVYLSTAGYGMYAVDDRGEDVVFDAILPYLSNGDFYRGIRYFAESVLELSKDSPKSDYNQYSYDLGSGNFIPQNQAEEKKFDWALSIIFFLIFGLASGFIYTTRLKGKLKSERMMRDAETYVVKDSFSLDSYKDLYLFSTVRRTPRAESRNSSGGSHSSVGHVSSSGRVHGGGGRSF